MARTIQISIVVLAASAALFAACGGGSPTPADSPEVVPAAEPPLKEPTPGDSDTPPNPTVGDAGASEAEQGAQ
jgi:hypothetical protein